MSGARNGGADAGWAHGSGLITLQSPAGSAGLGPEDRLLIHELFARYAIGLDERRMDVLAACFAQGAVYQVQLGPETLARYTGVGQIIEGLASVMSRQGPAQRRHSLTNLVVDASGPDEAVAIAYAAVFLADGQAPSVAAVAVYRATVVRTAEGWRFLQAVVGMDAYAGHSPRSSPS